MYIYEKKDVKLVKPDINKEIYMYKIIRELKNIFLTYLMYLSGPDKFRLGNL